MESFHSELFLGEENGASRDEIEVVLVEDPACSWCWAYQPVETALLYEYAGLVRFRRVLGGVRDFAIPTTQFAREQWRVAAEISGMPFVLDDFDPSRIESTWVACRVVKAAQILESNRASRLLRRLREALFVHGSRIDELDVALDLAESEGLDRDRLADYIASGRVDSFFAKDRRIASAYGFGLPTLIIQRRAPDENDPMTLDGIVSYAEVTTALGEAGVSLRRRRRFLDRPEDWDRLFQLRPRLAMAEIECVTQLARAEIRDRLADRGLDPTTPWIITEAWSEAGASHRPATATGVA